MSSKWKPVPTKMPDNGQVVYARTWNETAAPFKCIWVESTQTFQEIEHGINFPAYVIFKWYPAS